MQAAYCPEVEIQQVRPAPATSMRSARLDLLDMERITTRKSAKTGPKRLPTAGVAVVLRPKPLNRVARHIAPKTNSNTELHARYLQERTAARVVSIAYTQKQIQQRCVALFEQTQTVLLLKAWDVRCAWLDDTGNWLQPGHIRVIVEFETNRDLLERMARMDIELAPRIFKATGQTVGFGVHLPKRSGRMEPIPDGIQLFG